MTEELGFVQKLQDVYAKLTRLPIVICRLDGSLYTRISWGKHANKEYCEEDRMEKWLETLVRPLYSLNQSIVLDTNIGSKVIISPIKSYSCTKYFIVAGNMVESVQHGVKRNSQLNSNVLFKESLARIEIKNQVAYINELTDMITAHIALVDERNSAQAGLKLVSNKVKLINKENLALESILEVGTLTGEMNFISFATKSKDGMLTVKNSIGKYANVLKGYQFSVGQGILGYSVATQQPQVYKNITDDPRLSLFQQLNIEVISLYCYPIKEDNRVIGLLFGGSTKCEVVKVASYDNFFVCASLVTSHLLKHRLQSENNLQRMELYSLMEIFKVLTTVQDLKKVLYILIDIIMNITQAAYASIVYREKIDVDHVEIIARGISDEELQNYSERVSKNSLTTALEAEQWDTSILNQQLPKKGTWEFPIIFNEFHYGFLTIHFNEDTDLKEYKYMISSLAIAGGIAIHFLGNKERVSNEKLAVELIQRFLKNFKPESYELAEQIREMLNEFLQPMEKKDALIVEKLAFLSVIGHELVEILVVDENLLRLARKYYKVLEGKSGGNRLIESVAVVWAYYEKNQSIDSVFQLNLINQEIQEQYTTFIKRKKTSERKVELIEQKRVEEAIDKNADEDLLAELGLTDREKDVLHEVLKGLSNKEIADVLYISDHTVKNHMTNILTKLDVSDRVQAISKIYQLGYIPTP